MSSPPTQLLIGISGFLETEKRTSGIEDILWKTFSEVEHVATARFLWNDSLVTMRRLIRRIMGEWPDIEISILSYSYGGTTACALIDLLLENNIHVRNAFFIDPVWRPFRRLPSVFSIYGVGKLWVESNVDHAFVWRQRTTAIRGCTIKRRGTNTVWYEDELNFKHTRIDNSQLIQSRVIEEMQSYDAQTQKRARTRTYAGLKADTPS